MTDERESIMCSTNGVGGTPALPLPGSTAGGGAADAPATSTPAVAGANGADAPVAGGGATEGVAAVLAQLTSTIASLAQALQGGLLANASGGGATPMQGDSELSTCDMVAQHNATQAGGAGSTHAPIDVNGNGTGGASPDAGAQKKSGTKDGKADKADRPDRRDDDGPKQRDRSDRPDRPKRPKQRDRNEGTPRQRGGVDKPDVPSEPNGPTGPTGPTAAERKRTALTERRDGLREQIAGAKREQKSIIERMDRIAARIDKINSSYTYISENHHKKEKAQVARLTTTLNALRSAGGYISGGLPSLYQQLERVDKQLRKLG